MSDLISAINGVGNAADALLRACTDHCVFVDPGNGVTPIASTLRRTYREGSLLPSDMVATLARIRR